MKTKYLFLVLFVCTLLSGCSSNDDPTPTTTIEWNLISVTGGLAGVNDTFDPGLITWTFNSNTNTVIVVNNNTDDTLIDFFDSGTYTYVTTVVGSDVHVTIDGIEFGVITQTASQMTLDQQALDGYLVTFTK
ncbi:MAG: hypothetical protein KDD03_00905 [Gelidibacter sp.]|nr:hypothetical protein [Gelidibacter sp.]